MKDENYINIQGWMINRLKLKGNDLVVYALIYGFSQDGESKFRGSLSYMQNALTLSKPTIISILDKLEKNQLINKEINSSGNLYSINLSSKETLLEVVKKLDWGSKETLLVSSKETLLVSSKETLHNNNIYNNKNINKNNCCEDFSSITSKEIKNPVVSLKHGTKTIRDLLSILVEKKIMSEQNFSKLNLEEIEEYFIEHALIHLSGFKKKLPATMPDELMTNEEYLKTFGYGRTIIESRMVLYYGDDWEEELKRRRKEFDQQAQASGYDGADLLFSKIETMIDWCIRSNREIKNLKTTFLTFIKPKKFK